MNQRREVPFRPRFRSRTGHNRKPRDADDVEVLQTAAGRLTSQIRLHFPDRFAVDHRLVNKQGVKAEIHIQTMGHGPQMMAQVEFENIMASSEDDSDESAGIDPDDIDGEVRSISEIANDITAAFFQQLYSQNPPSLLKQSPAR